LVTKLGYLRTLHTRRVQRAKRCGAIAPPLRNPGEADMRVGIAGRDDERGAECGLRRIQLTQGHTREPQLDLRIAVAGIGCDQRFEQGGGACRVPGKPGFDSHVIVGGPRILRLRCGGAAKGQGEKIGSGHRRVVTRRAKRLINSSGINGFTR